MYFKIALKVTKFVSYFDKKIYQHDLSESLNLVALLAAAIGRGRPNKLNKKTTF